MSISDEDVSDKRVKEKINEFSTKYPVFTAILERIPIMDLKEVVSVMVLVDPVREVLKTHATRLTFIGENKELDQFIEDKINELRTKYAALAGVLERIHKMDLRETAIGLLGIDAMESLLKLRTLVILASWFLRAALPWKNKVVARALSSSSIYPCPIQNRFECPYDIKVEEKEEEEGEEVKSIIIDVDQLFQLSEIAFLVELAFATAEKNTSKIQIKNVQDVYNALTDKVTFDKPLQQGLDEEHQEYKDKIVQFFMSIKDKVRIEDLTCYG